ncbi:MAG: cation:proton antiporter [Armatimonadota bacterium]
MLGDVRFIFELTVIVAAGFLGALGAHFLRLPVIAGYLLVGFLLGPSGLGLLKDSALISQMAEFGIAVLMFTIGLELSVRSLSRMKPAALIAAPIQIVATAALGYGVGMSLGFGDAQSVVLGFILALSSTMVVVKLLSARGEMHTRHGQAMVAVLLTQDLAAVLMVATLPLLSDLIRDNVGFRHYAVVAGKGALFVALILVFARWIAPAVLRLVARSYSKEVFIVMAAALCFTGAATASWLGLSLALGAFAAGLVISESHYSHEIMSDMTPLRDLFGMVFFVSLGLLFDVGAVGAHADWTIALALAVFLGKPVVAAIGMLAAGYHPHNAIVAGLGLAQIGEFSFLVAALGLRLGLLGEEAHSSFIAVAGVSLLLTPAMMRSGSVLYDRLRRWERGDGIIGRYERQAQPEPAVQFDNHVIVCGFGRVGRVIGEALSGQEVPFVVVEYDQHTLAELSRRHIPAVYGDASRLAVLAAAGAERARLAVIALPDGASARLALHHLQELNPTIRIVARVHQSRDLEDTCRDGASEVVYAEHAASLEMLRHTMLILERDPEEVEAMITALRENSYCRLVLEQEPDRET